MKFRIGLGLIIAAFLVVGCEQVTEPGQDQLFYRGIPVSEGAAPWVLGGNQLGRVNSGAVELDTETQGTVVYGTEDESEVYQASGGEVLPVGTWVDDAAGDTYSADVLKKTVLTFEESATVEIYNPINTFYLDANGEWIEVANDCTVITTSIKTGPSGSCKISSPIKFSIGGDGGDQG